MNNSELAAILQRQIDNSITGGSSDIDSDSADAMDYYLGKPFGTEVDGQSKIVTRDVLETIEWVMPSLMRPFISGEKTVVFDPTGLEDEDQAEQETEVVNRFALNENNGFLFYLSWFKDALIQRVGYAKVWVEDVETTETQTYSGLSEVAYVKVLAQDNVEALEHTERTEEIEIPTPQGVMVQPITLHDIKIRVTTKEKKFRLDVVPQDEIRVSKKARSICLDDAPFVAHERILTATDLLEMGIDKATIKELPSFTGSDSQLKTTRSEDEDDTVADYVDESMREIQVFECYVRVDYDGDGKAELRRILLAGKEILENEEADFIPFEAITPIIMPHKHTGLSEADLVMDLQLIKSTLMRQILNNLYLTNNPEKEVVEPWVANMEDLLESAPGNIKRVNQPGAIREIAVPFTAGASLPILELLDSMQEKRTGVSRTTQGMDADVLAQSTKGAFMGALEQANQRIEMLARTFAETGVKGIFKKLHELVIKHQDQKKVMKIRNKWIEVDPTEWKHRSNMSVVVGVGTGNKDQLLSRLFAIVAEQKEMLVQGVPVVSPQNLYNTYAKIVEAGDLKNAALYFTDPATIPPKPPQPQVNPLAEVEQIKGQFKLQSDQMQAQLKMALVQMQEQSKRDLELMKMRLEQIENEKDRNLERTLTAAKEEIKAFMEGLRIDIGQPGIGAGLDARPTN